MLGSPMRRGDREQDLCSALIYANQLERLSDRRPLEMMGMRQSDLPWFLKHERQRTGRV